MNAKELAERQFQLGGILLGRSDDGSLIGSKDDRHIMTIAGSRAGKSSTCLMPNLLVWNSSALVIDPKGELASETAETRARMGQDVFILDPFGEVKGPAQKFRARYDPLSEIKAGSEDDIIDNASLIADALIVPDKDAKSDHWTLGAKNLLRGLILYALLVEQSRGLPASLNRVRGWITSRLHGNDEDDTQTPEEADDDQNIWLTTRFRLMGLRDEFSGVIAGIGSSMMGKPSGERASIISTAVEQTSFLDSKPMKDHLGQSDLPLLPSLRVLKRKPCTIYLVLPASRMGTHFRWLRTILTLAMATLENEPHKLGDDKSVLFVLEEFPQLGYMRLIEAAAGLMAGYKVKLWTILQDLSQLKSMYRDSWETFFGNAGVIQAFGNTDATTTEYLSRAMGNTVITEEKDGARTASAIASGAAATQESNKSVPLLAPFEIPLYAARETGKQLILFAGKHPAYIDRLSHEDVQSLR